MFQRILSVDPVTGSCTRIGVIFSPKQVQLIFCLQKISVAHKMLNWLVSDLQMITNLSNQGKKSILFETYLITLQAVSLTMQET